MKLTWHEARSENRGLYLKKGWVALAFLALAAGVPFLIMWLPKWQTAALAGIGILIFGVAAMGSSPWTIRVGNDTQTPTPRQSPTEWLFEKTDWRLEFGEG